jgi:hypothetical protein
MKPYIPARYVCRISYMSAERSVAQVRQLGPVFRSKDAIGAGMSWRDLYRLRDDGDIVQLSRGLFQLADVGGMERIDFVVVCARAPHGMVCLNSALSYWDLSDEIPGAVHLAVPEGTHRPTIDHPPTTVHVFGARTFNVGRVEITERGASFWITDRERAVVDAFRLRHLVGEDLAHGAIRRYLSQRPKRTRLAGVARDLGAFTSLSAALRILEA